MPETKSKTFLSIILYYTRPKRKEHQIAVVKPVPVAASAADKDSHSETNKACSEQQTTKKSKTRLRFQ